MPKRRRQRVEEAGGRFGPNAGPYVLSADVKPYVERALLEHEANHPTKGRYWTGQVGPLSWLEQESKMPVRRIYDILHDNQLYITYYTAERVLIATGDHYMIMNGQIEVHETRSMSAMRAFRARRGHNSRGQAVDAQGYRIPTIGESSSNGTDLSCGAGDIYEIAAL